MSTITVAFDDNLGYPQGFIDHLETTASGGSERANCQQLSFHELDEMIDTFVKGDVQVMLLPCGCIPYLDVPVRILAQTTVGRPPSTALTSTLFVSSDHDAGNPASVAHLRIGSINKFCTTSYWAPQIFERGTGCVDQPLAADGVGRRLRRSRREPCRRPGGRCHGMGTLCPQAQGRVGGVPCRRAAHPPAGPDSGRVNVDRRGAPLSTERSRPLREHRCSIDVQRSCRP